MSRACKLFCSHPPFPGEKPKGLQILGKGKRPSAPRGVDRPLPGITGSGQSNSPQNIEVCSIPHVWLLDKNKKLGSDPLCSGWLDGSSPS